jgi:hypothetical protein
VILPEHGGFGEGPDAWVSLRPGPTDPAHADSLVAARNLTTALVRTMANSTINTQKRAAGHPTRGCGRLFLSVNALTAHALQLIAPTSEATCATAGRGH